MQAPTEFPPPPAGLRLVKAGSELVIEWRWFRARNLFVLLCGAPLIAFFVFWYSRPFPPGAWLFYVVPVVPLAIAAWGMYTALAGLVNTTTLRIANGWLSVHHAPLPWPRTWKLPSDRIRRFHIRSRIPTRGRPTPFAYEVQAEGEGLGRVKLLTDLHSLAQAEFIAWVVKHHLGIECDPDPAA